MTEQTAPQGETKAPVPGSPEYNAAMLAVKQAAREEASNPYVAPDPALTDKPADKPAKPEGVPDKFWNAETGQVDVEGLLQSYTELESKLGKKDEPVEPPKADDKEVQKTVENAGLDWNAVTAKVAETGDIEEADYAALEAKGIPRALVKEVIELRKEQHAAEQQKAVDYIGGKEAVESLFGWAQTALTEEEINTYNELLAGPNWRVAVDSLKARQASTSKTAAEPKLVLPTKVVSGTVTGYATPEDRKADMANPLYRDRTSKGEAFRAEVMRKTAASSWFRK